MKLNKRNCEVRIRLTPCGTDFLKVHFRIGGDNHYFLPSGVMGDQFNAFIWATYVLYEEERLPHLFYFRGNKEYRCEYTNQKDGETETTAFVTWDEERTVTKIKLSRTSKKRTPAFQGEADPVEVELDTCYGKFHYTIDGRDLCYAVARGCTEALKKYGIQGYIKSTGNQYYGDGISMNALLFIKAYALDALEARETRFVYQRPNGWEEAEGSSFEKEIELLLFDM